MGEVRYFDGGTMLNERGYNENCVKFLEELLQKAKDGEIVGICVGMQYADGSNGATGAGFVYNQRMIGSLMSEIMRLSSS